MGNLSLKEANKIQQDFILANKVDFNKLAKDVARVQRVFKINKYLEMIGFDISFKMYFTPNQKSGIHELINLKSKVQRKVERLHFSDEKEELEYFLTHKWDKMKYLKVLVTMMDIGKAKEIRMNRLNER